MVGLLSVEAFNPLLGLIAYEQLLTSYQLAKLI